MTTRAPWLLVAVLAACRGPAAKVVEPRHVRRPPNIVVMLADDLGWGDVGYHGSGAKTPTLDRMARTGVALDQHYVTPQCTPTRAALLTGRYPSRFDALAATNAPAFPADTITLPKVLKARGYDTAMIGKWHLGLALGHRPWEQGFDHSYGALTGAVHPWQHTGARAGHQPDEERETWHRNGERLDQKGESATELITREAETWIRGRTDRPWFLYFAHFGVHTPVDAPDRYKALYQRAGLDDDHLRYYAFTSQVDEAMARIERVLASTGQLENTVILFLSDNGARGAIAPKKDGGQYGDPLIESAWLGSNAPLRGDKASTWEGGIRTPAFVYAPGRLDHRQVGTPLHVVDWLPTLTGLTGDRSNLPVDLDGVDVLAVLEGHDAPLRTLYWKYVSGMGAIRRGDWKLVLPGDGPFARRRMPSPDRMPQLFDLRSDPTEQNDLIADHPALAAELRALMAKEAERDDVGRIYQEHDPFQWRP